MPLCHHVGNTVDLWRNYISQSKISPGYFRQICRKKISNSLAREGVVFSTDTCLTNSIKSMERKRRGVTEKLILGRSDKEALWLEEVYLPTNDENASQLIKLPLVERQRDEYALDLHGRRLFLICTGKVYIVGLQNGHTTNLSEVTSLQSNRHRIIQFVCLRRLIL